MFTVLTTEYCKGMRYLKPQLERYEIENSHFYRVNIPRKRKRIKTKKAAKILRQINLPVVFGKDIEVCDYEGVVPVNSRQFKARLLANAVSAIFPASVVISDRFGEFSHCLDTIIRTARQVHIVTENPSAYSEENMMVFKNRGASASISTSPLNVKYDIMFSPFSDSSRVLCDASILVGEEGFDLVNDRLGVPYKYRKQKPEMVDEIDFAAALYEQCGITELENCIPEKIVNKTTSAFINLKKFF